MELFQKVEFPAHQPDFSSPHFLIAMSSLSISKQRTSSQERVITYTDLFHMRLHQLLHAQGIFQVLQRNLPENIHEFMEAHQHLINAHSSFLQTHCELVEAHVQIARLTERHERIEAHRPPPISPIPIQSPPMIPRMAPAEEDGFSTPVKSHARRQLNFDLTCSESFDEA